MVFYIEDIVYVRVCISDKLSVETFLVYRVQGFSPTPRGSGL